MRVHGLALGLWVALSPGFLWGLLQGSVLLAGSFIALWAKNHMVVIMAGNLPAGTTVPHSWFFSGEVFPFWAFPLPNEVWSWLVKLRQCDFRHPPLSLWDYTESVCHLWGLHGCSRVFLPP